MVKNKAPDPRLFEHLQWKPGMPKAEARIGERGASETRMVQVSGDTFQFFGVPYQGGVLPCIERTMQYLDGGVEKNQDKHLEWLAEPANNPNDWTLADMELEYQMLRMSFELRNHQTFGAVASEYIKQIRELYDNGIVTADHIEYLPDGLEAVITNKGSVPTQPEKRVIIPTYTNNRFLLSKERPEAQLDTIEIQDQQTNEFLQSYLGRGYEQAGAIFSYCSSRNNTQLRKTQLWTPDPNDRIRSPQRVGGLGFGSDVGVDIYVAYEDVNGSWRALPVAIRV